MKVAVAFALFSLVALAVLIPSSAAPSGCDCDSDSSSVSVKSKKAASSSDVKASQGSKSAVVSEVGGVKYAAGAEQSSYSEDKDTECASEQQVAVKNKDGSTYNAKKSVKQTASVDVDKTSSSSYSKVEAADC